MLDNGQRKYEISPGAKDLDEKGSEWQIKRVRYPIYGNAKPNVYEECIINCLEINEYSVKFKNVKTYDYSVISEGSSDMLCTLTPNLENRFAILCSFETIGENVVENDNYYATSSEIKQVKMSYTFEGVFKNNQDSGASITSATAKIKAGRIDALATEFDDIMMLYPKSPGYSDMHITLNGKTVSSY